MPCVKEYHTARLQFVVGDEASVVTNLPDDSYDLLETGGTQMMFNLNVVNDSVEVFFNGGASPLPRKVLDQVSYNPTYTTDNTLVTFWFGMDMGASAGQMIIVRLNYLTTT